MSRVGLSTPQHGEPRTNESRHKTPMATARAQIARAADLDPSIWADGPFSADMMKARWDISYFSRRFLGFDPHPGQEELWRAIIMRDLSGWRPRFLDINDAAGNRAGKTLGIAIPMLHSTLFKIGMEPPNPLDEKAVARWSAAAYEWWHFALQQEISELAYIELTRLLSGTHEAQKDGCPLTREVGKGFADWSKKYRGEYLWIRLHEAFGGGEMHFRTTGEKAVAQLGKDMAGISYDEAGFDPHMEFIVNEVLHMRRLSTGGQLWCIGTSTEGLTAFADRWEEGNPENPLKRLDSYSLRMSTRQNIGYGIDQAMFDRIVSSMPADLIPQNIDGQFLQGAHAFFAASSVKEAFVAELNGKPLEGVTSAIKDHHYTQGVDPAMTFDSCWSIMLDDTHRGQVVGVHAERSRGRTTGPVIVAIATNAHNAYNQGGASCQTGVDGTAFGGKFYVGQLDIKPVRVLEFTAGKKLRYLNVLKRMLEEKKLKFPATGAWLELRRQLLGYRLDDKKLETDGVMALAVAAFLVSLRPEGSQPKVAFDFFHSGVSLPEPIAGPRNASYRSMSDFLRDGS